MKENQNKQEKKKIIDKAYYQKNAPKKREQRKIRYQQDKQKQKKELAKKVNKYSQVENYKVLITFKEYTLLNKDKQEKWFDFSRTLKDLADNGVHNTSELMRLSELAHILITDYRETAKREEFKGKRWPSLTEKKKQEFIKFWAREKVRQELALAEGLEAMNERAKEYEKDIAEEKEMNEFHLERGKQKCKCWQCAANKPPKAEKSEKKEQCPECKKWVKKLDEEEGICKSCLSSYNN